MKNILTVIFLLLTIIVAGQTTKGTISGTVYDKEVNNEPLPFANVFIKGTSIGTTTEFEGTYTFQTEPGTYTLVFSFIGYKTVEVPNVIVKSGETVIINQILSASEGVSLSEIQITATANKESESALLTEQKKAVAIEQKIGAQELSRKGVSDVATALTKTTGISKQEGSGGVFVRGLGDRYNVTTLNGLPLPSNNPSKKNIDLDIFSTDIVEYISIDKTYNTKNYGDFAGANVDIASKNYKGNGFLEIEIGTGANIEVISQNNFYLNDGPNFSGFYNKNHPKFPLSNYNFTTSWNREKVNSPINISASLKGGDSYTFGEGSKISFFTVASFDNGYKFREGISKGSTSPYGLTAKEFDFTSYEYNTNSTVMGNIAFSNLGTTLKYNTLFVNTTSQKQQEYDGIIDVFDYASNGGGLIQRSTFEKTALLVNQLLGNHKIKEQLEADWGVSYNTVKNDVPNRRQTTLSPDNPNEPEGPKSFKNVLSTSDNHRFYHELTEDELAANISGTYKFDKNEDEDFNGKVTVGYSGKIKNINFEAIQFNFDILINNNGTPINQPIIEDVYNLDAYFNQENFNAGLFKINTFRGGANVPIALDPQSYEGNQDIHAAFVSFEYSFSPKLVVVAGVRAEEITQFIKWSTALDPEGGESKFNTTEILPMLSLKYILNDKQNLKFAASKTYTLPQFKERAPFLYDEITQTSFGNPTLYASKDYNADFKWELFPKSNEIISLGAFGKYIQNPINEFTVNSASNDVSYVNSGDYAVAYGAELEYRKGIFENEIEKGVDFLKSTLSIGFNASYMNTNQKLDDEKVLKETTEAGFPLSTFFTNDEDKLTGASDLLLNADISFFKEYSADKNLLSTLTFNYFSDRVYALGTQGKGNLVEKGVGSLDFITKYQMNKNLTIGITAKNILNPTIERFQETQDVTVSSYKAGISTKLSISYNF